MLRSWFYVVQEENRARRATWTPTCTGEGDEENAIAVDEGEELMLTILVVLLLLALLGGGVGHSRVGLAGWSPAGIIAVVLIVMLVTGRI